MKKVASVCLVFVLLVSLVGCGGKSTVNSTNTRLGKQAIQLIDDYFDGKITLDELYDAFYDKYEAIDFADDSEGYFSYHIYMSFAISNIAANLSKRSNDIDHLISLRNEIAKMLGAKEIEQEEPS